MPYKGHVQNGAIVLDEPIDLPEGALVSVELSKAERFGDVQEIPTLAERLATVIGKADGLPADWAENHDIYLRKAHGK